MAFEEGENLGGGGAISQINVAPLVDVMLVLLVIFMVTAPMLQEGVELELPNERVAAIAGNGEQLVVSIDKDGLIYLGKGNTYEPTELVEKLKAIMVERNDDRVFIRADHRVAYGRVMSVMASLKRSGIQKVGLVTEPK